MANEIPVYLFVGFLESGKTKFIQETFEDPNFDSGDKTLLLICEEGEEEYNEKKFAFPGVTVKVLEDKAELNPQNLLKLEKESGAGRVVIEYNGMWLLQDLAEALPESWIVYQCIATADGTTALTYARDNSMRSLMLDKIARSELIVFNRAEAVNTAEGEAARFNSVYDEYVKAPEVTRRRMYLETMERVLGSVNKVILDGEGGQGVAELMDGRADHPGDGDARRGAHRPDPADSARPGARLLRRRRRVDGRPDQRRRRLDR